MGENLSISFVLIQLGAGFSVTARNVHMVENQIVVTVINRSGLISWMGARDTTTTNKKTHVNKSFSGWNSIKINANWIFFSGERCKIYEDMSCINWCIWYRNHQADHFAGWVFWTASIKSGNMYAQENIGLKWQRHMWVSFSFRFIRAAPLIFCMCYKLIDSHYIVYFKGFVEWKKCGVLAPKRNSRKNAIEIERMAVATFRYDSHSFGENGMDFMEQSLFRPHFCIPEAFRF